MSFRSLPLGTVFVALMCMSSINEALAKEASKSSSLGGLSTRFDTPAALSGWKTHEVRGWASKWGQQPRIENGCLVLRPHSSGWFDDNQAGHLYRQVKGDFIVTTRVKVSGTEGTLPQTDFSLAGLFVRAP